MGKFGVILFSAVIVLATIWAYNRFSGRSIAALGVPSKS